MRVVAFAGPSLPSGDRERYPGAEWRPPAEAGDLLRLDPAPDLILCLIDGYFDHRPAVRHKEILLLLSEGARIFGASSIGALRAAEMDGLGMTGIGAVYRAYADGRIEGDDEVALVHAPAEWDWRPLSIPLVEVRATLCRAVRARSLATGEARALLSAAAQVHYADRSWDAVLERASAELRGKEGLRGRLEEAFVPQKRIDANACLAAATRAGPSPAERPAAVKTAFLRALARECGSDLRGRPVQAPRPAERRNDRGDGRR